MNVTEEQTKKIFEHAIDELAYSFDAELYDGYSGRGMYGEKCLGIVLDSPHSQVEIAFHFFRAISLVMDIDDVDRVADIGEKIIPRRFDNLGRDYIYY